MFRKSLDIGIVDLIKLVTNPKHPTNAMVTTVSLVANSDSIRNVRFFHILLNWTFNAGKFKKSIVPLSEFWS